MERFDPRLDTFRWGAWSPIVIKAVDTFVVGHAFVELHPEATEYGILRECRKIADTCKALALIIFTSSSHFSRTNLRRILHPPASLEKPPST